MNPARPSHLFSVPDQGSICQTGKKLRLKAPDCPTKHRLHTPTAALYRFPVCMSGLRPVDSCSMADVTQILDAIEQGNPHAAEQLLPLVYEELRKLAAQKLAQEAP